MSDILYNNLAEKPDSWGDPIYVNTDTPPIPEPVKSKKDIKIWEIGIGLLIVCILFK